MKNTDTRNLKNIGSVQVIEMSFVLPIIMGVLIGLIYLTFFMFLYVYSYVLAETATDKVADLVRCSDISLFENNHGLYGSDEERRIIYDEIETRLDTLCILPGMEAFFDYSVEGNLFNPEINIKITISFLDGDIISTSTSRTVYNPSKFADNFDLFKRNYHELF